MRVNTRSKGRRMELRCAKMLEDVGYAVQLAPNPSKWSLQNDLFGLWDMEALRGDEVLWVQIKTNRKPTKTEMEPFEQWRYYGRKQIWIFYDGKKKPVIIDVL